jgi:hypothetical protein
MKDRSHMIRLAMKMEKGSQERRTLLSALMKQAGRDTAQFVDWVILNFDDSPMSEQAMTAKVERILGRGPSQYVATTRRGPTLAEGDLVMPKPEKAPPANQEAAEAYRYQPGTVERVTNEGLLVKFENGQTILFYGFQSGVKTGLYRYTPTPPAPTAGVQVEAVYFSRPGEVEQYRRHVVEQYVERGRQRDEDRSRVYYSGMITGFKVTKKGETVITLTSQQRPYPVTINPKQGRLLYLNRQTDRPSWQQDFANDVREIQEEAEEG